MRLLTFLNQPTGCTLRLLSCPLNRSCVTVRILHVFRILCSRFISGFSGSPAALGPMAPRRSWAKANKPYCSSGVASWYAGHQDVEEYCRRCDISTASFLRWMRHLLSLEDLRQRKERLRNLRREALERRQSKRPPGAEAPSLRRARGQRSDRSSGVPGRACRSDELERHGARRVRRSARTFAARAAHLARSSGTIQQRNGLAKPASSEYPSAIKQRC